MVRSALVIVGLVAVCFASACIDRNYNTGETDVSSAGGFPDEPERRNRLEAFMEQTRARDCAENVYSPEMLDESEVDTPGNIVPFERPPLVPLANPPAGSHPDLVNVPSGMAVLGKLNTARNTVVFVPGWSPCGQSAIFRFAAKWHRAGWNTAILRWHHGAFDLFNIPIHAEQSVWRSVGDFGVQEWHRLENALGSNYQGRVWLVTHSLGIFMTSFMMQAVMDEGNFKLLPHRLDVIDPYISFWRDFPKDSRLYASLGSPANLGIAMERVFTNLRYKSGVVTVFHAAGIGLMSASNLMAWNNRVIMSSRWRSAGQAHVDLSEMFFRSIEEKGTFWRIGPGGAQAISAATPESELRGRGALRFVQVDGFKSDRYSDMKFETTYANP